VAGLSGAALLLLPPSQYDNATSGKLRIGAYTHSRIMIMK
jgi:hypothetical protein